MTEPGGGSADINMLHMFNVQGILLLIQTNTILFKQKCVRVIERKKH